MSATLAHSYAERRGRDFVRRLGALLRVPSISGDPAKRRDVAACADKLAQELRTIGMAEVSVLRTGGHPVVLAAWRLAHGAPTLLIYGHYDVQPPGARDEWRSPPFTPVVRGEHLYGRGAIDDKGQVWAHVCALESWLRGVGRLPLNVVCLFEGEEEIGSPHLAQLLRRHARMLAADAAVISDTRTRRRDRPAVTISLRGHLVLAVRLSDDRGDLHSGQFGGAIVNPLDVLCTMVAKLHDGRGRAAVPGFYARVPDRRLRGGLSDAEILAAAGSRAARGETGFDLYESTAVRPSLEVTSLTAGERTLAALPSHADARLDVRLVQGQRLHEAERHLRIRLAELAHPALRLEVQTVKRTPAVELDAHHWAVRAAVAATRRGFGVAPDLLRSGGSIPVVAMLQSQLGLPAVLLGFAAPGDHMHAAQERLHLPTFHRAVATLIAFLEEIPRAAARPRRAEAA